MSDLYEYRDLESGFEHYLEAKNSWDDLVLDDKIVVLDANILLKLYELRQASLEKVLQGLERIQERLFLPAQVQTEFWRNRDEVLKRCRQLASQQQLAEAKSATSAFVQQARSHRVTDEDRAQWQKTVSEFFSSLEKGLGEGELKNRASLALADPEKDVVLSRLRGIYRGRVGESVTTSALATIKVEFAERCAAGIPPGNRDSHKQDGGYGDFLVWQQLCSQAARESRGVVFVTDDLKDDWWRLFSPRDPINARFELVDELRRLASVDLRLIPFGVFLERLAEDDGAEVTEEILDEVDAPLSGTTTPGPVPNVDEWRVEYLAILLDYLRDNGAASQARVLLSAAQESTGVLKRPEVLEILGRSASQKLTGFTRVFNSAQRVLTDNGLLPAGLPPALKAQYDGPGKAQRFAVPRALAGVAAGVELWEAPA